MSEPLNEVPDGTAIFPMIPAELGLHPLLLAVLHAVVFFDGSSEDVVNDAAADESLQYIATYMQRLADPELKRVQGDMERLLEYAVEQSWPEEELQFLKTFLADYGVRS
jgi:hypothetical protein